MVEIKPTSILHCPSQSIKECRYTKGKNKGKLTPAITECKAANGNNIKNCKCSTTQVTATPECAAFAHGFNVTSSLLGVLFGSMLLIVAAVKLARFAGEDG